MKRFKEFLREQEELETYKPGTILVGRLAKRFADDTTDAFMSETGQWYMIKNLDEYVNRIAAGQTVQAKVLDKKSVEILNQNIKESNELSGRLDTWAIRWAEFDNKGNQKIKQKEFKTEQAFNKFHETIEDRDGFYEVLAVSYPRKD